jgi:hypothetical protein
MSTPSAIDPDCELRSELLQSAGHIARARELLGACPAETLLTGAFGIVRALADMVTTLDEDAIIPDTGHPLERAE